MKREGILSAMTVSDYIKRFADRSKTPQHELILECLEHYVLHGTRDLTLEQATEWWELFVQQT